MQKLSLLLFFVALLTFTLSAQSGLVGYYSFCNCNANDNSGNGNHGTLVGNPQCIPGQRGEGFLFNQNPGNNGCGQPGGEYVQLPSLGAIWQDGFTVCAWVRYDNTAYFERIIDFGNESGDNGGMPVWFGREDATNNLTLESWISSDAQANRTTGRLVAANAITNGSIEYYCATISQNTMRIYVNGVLKAEKIGHPILNVPRSRNYIGRSNWCGSDPDFKGFMDEVRIYNRALSESEINSLYLQTPTFANFQSPVCAGAPVQLEAQGGTTYEWSPAQYLNNVNIANPVATPQNTITYRCRIAMADGCFYTDSLHIEVLPAPMVNRQYTVCQGGSVTVGGTVFNAANPSGSILAASPSGCDTVVQVQLAFLPPPAPTEVKQYSCRRANIGVVVLSIQTPSGCDSLVRIETLYDSTLIARTSLQEGVCEPALEGVDSLWLISAANCDSLVVRHRVFDPALVPVLTLQSRNTTCPEVSNGQIQVEQATGGIAPYQYALENAVFQSDGVFDDLIPGVYTVTILDAAGCMSAQEAEIGSDLGPQVWLAPDTTIAWGKAVRLTPLINAPGGVDSLSWTPSATLDCISCQHPTVTPGVGTSYQVTVYSPDGCTATATQNIMITRDVIPVYLPNVFDPEASYPNNEFNVFAEARIHSVRFLRVYDRWGAMVFDNGGFAPGTPNAGWDGRFRGKLVDTGVYVVYCELEMPDGSVERYQGDVTVIR